LIKKEREREREREREKEREIKTMVDLPLGTRWVPGYPFYTYLVM